VGISCVSVFLLYRVSKLVKSRVVQTRVQKEEQVIMEKEEFLIE